MRRLLYSALLIGLAATQAAAQPVITSINDASRTRSGRVSIEGTGFGASGDVRSSVSTVAIESPFTDPHSFLYAIELGEETGLVGDVDGNGTVDFADLLAPLSAWGPCAPECPADVDGDGTVGFADLLKVLANWS